MPHPASMRSPSRPGRKKGHTRRQVHTEKRQNSHSVCLIGDAKIVVFDEAGDNCGKIPVAIVISKKSEDALRNYNRGWRPLALFEWVHVPTEEHAKRLKAFLDRSLLGQVEAQGNDTLRLNWRDVRGCFSTEEERAMWWATLLDDASREVQKSVRGFRVWTNADREKDILRYLGGKP